MKKLFIFVVLSSIFVIFSQTSAKAAGLFYTNATYPVTATGNEVKELSTDDWKEIIVICQEVGIPQLTFTGGEPTLRNDLVELIDYSRWFVTRLNTNGLLLSKKLCQKLYEASLDSIQVTLYSYDKSRHEFLTGNINGFEKTVEKSFVCCRSDGSMSSIGFSETLGNSRSEISWKSGT